MTLAKKFLIITKLLLIFGNFIESKQNWSYEIISFATDNKTPDVITSDIRRVRVSRGVYAVSGTYHVKQDLTDDLHMSAIMYYSPTGSSNYMQSPFQIFELNLTKFANTYYKDILMEDLRRCADNPVTFEDVFVAPVTKRFVTLDECTVSNENMPSVVRSGYYRLEFKLLNQANITYTVLTKVEQDN